MLAEAYQIEPVPSESAINDALAKENLTQVCKQTS
jgi:hypothetical protein